MRTWMLGENDGERRQCKHAAGQEYLSQKNTGGGGGSQMIGPAIIDSGGLRQNALAKK